MGSSLSLLVSNLVETSFDRMDKDYVAHSGSCRTHLSRDDIPRQLLCKAVYPCEYKDSWDRFNETSLPPPEDFYISLFTESISQKDYEHAQTIWREFGCHSMGAYHDLYLYTAALLIANMFDEF